MAQENFDLLRKETLRAAADRSDALGKHEVADECSIPNGNSGRNARSFWCECWSGECTV